MNSIFASERKSPSLPESGLTVFTFLTSFIIPFVDEQVAWTLWEPGQDEELQEGWDARGGEQDGPVLLFAQERTVKPRRSQSSVPGTQMLRKGSYFAFVKLNIPHFVYLRPITCPARIPPVMKMEVPVPIKPRNAVGAISPRYRG